MPELPEVENVRLSLIQPLIGQQVVKVRILRRDIITGPHRAANLLAESIIRRVDRRGKQLAICGEQPGQGGQTPCICVHLGMTGSLLHLPANQRQPLPQHTHLVWHLMHGQRLIFHDPRRFGGIWTFSSTEDLLTQRWSRLGEDALTIRPARLHRRFQATNRCLKAVLLDQAVIAGLGNIYVDELLFVLGLHPAHPACRLDPQQVEKLVRAMRRLLRQAIRQGGSTFRSYANALGQPGGYQQRHQVYARAGQPCFHCGEVLRQQTVAGRTSVTCPQCQPLTAS